MEPLAYAMAGAGLVIGVAIGFFFGKQAVVPAAPMPEIPLRPSPPAVKKPSGEPLRLLAILQREGRLLDFLLEDISAYQDAQVGAAVRDIHRGCRKAVDEHLVLERILAGDEGQPVTVPTGFDPAAIRLTGNVTGQPPFTGTLQHHGWRVKELKLPDVGTGRDAFVVAPAEVSLA
jgi:Domain of unknown function (DUF2760)